MNHPWLKDTIQYDPYEEPDYPLPAEGPTDLPKQMVIAIWMIENRYRTPSVDKAVRVYTVAQESRFLPILPNDAKISDYSKHTNDERY